MTLRPEYSLGHSQYNDFLFAPVGEEKTGQQLTVLTLLTRLELDPWREAARLADLPREQAARSLAATIVRLPEDERRSWDPVTIARRAVSALPTSSTPPVPPMPLPRERGAPGPGEVRRRPRTPLTTWLLCGALAVAVVLVLLNLQGAHQLEPGWQPDAPHSERS